MSKIMLVGILSVLLSASIASAQYDFYSGKDWEQINAKPLPDATKRTIKEAIVRTVQGASTFSGSPVLPAQEIKIGDYVDMLDKYYAEPETGAVPLHFALKIVNMRRQGITGAQIDIYEREILKKTESQAS